jgi:hypothetical protein
MRRPLSFWLLSMLASASATSARAEIGFEGGVRFGYGLPAGEFSGVGGPLGTAVSGTVPLMVDLGIRVMPAVFVGAFAQYGFGIAASEPGGLIAGDDAFVSSAHTARLGAQAHYHFKPGNTLDPWLGAGLGYEWLSFVYKSTNVTLSETASGFEFFELQAGLDIVPVKHLYLGPFLGFTLAEYMTEGVECVNCELTASSADIEDKALHYWLFLGVRGGFEP